MSGPATEEPFVAPEHNYPVKPGDGNAERFTAGLWIDVAKVLRDHGYPDFQGADLVDLQMALYDFVFGHRSNR